MNRNEYLTLITNSNNEDWYFSDEYTATFKNDLSIRLKLNADMNNPFYEEWAINHPDKTNWRETATFFYNQSIIYVLNLVSVDGGRATLPYPDLKTNKIPSFKYNLAKICWPEHLDEYIKRSGLSIDYDLDTEEKMDSKI
jgi:hypothetical protein